MSIRNKLAIIVVAFCSTIIVRSLLGHQALQIISSIRAYVHGEAIWSKAQKDAVHFLLQYVLSEDEKDYGLFQAQLAIPLGDRQARLELEKENPDFEVVKNGFALGKNHQDDIPSMFYLFKRFRNFSDIKEATKTWAEGDQKILELMSVAERVRAEAKKGRLSSQQRQAYFKELERLNLSLTEIEKKFSSILITIAHRFQNFIVKVMLVSTWMIIFFGGALTFFLFRGFLRDIELLHNGTIFIEQGDYSKRIEVARGDELGKLVHSFNRMIESLQTTTAERDRAQIQITNASRMAALGEMAGAVAHEINTPLSSILMCAERVRTLSKSNEPSAAKLEEIREYIEILVSTVGSVSKIINGLRHFARDGRNDAMDPTDLTTVVQQTLSLCSEKMKFNGIIPEFVPPTQPVIANCRSVEIGQVVLNLLNNAFDAVTEKKKRDAWLKIAIAETDSSVEIRISDSGPGIPDDILNKLFEPFFTTKGPGKGTGLGLSISQGIVSSHGGSLFVDKAAKNTTFVISLPKPRPDAARAS